VLNEAVICGSVGSGEVVWGPQTLSRSPRATPRVLVKVIFVDPLPPESRLAALKQSRLLRGPVRQLRAKRERSVVMSATSSKKKSTLHPD
jgi:hypothetical protein